MNSVASARLLIAALVEAGVRRFVLSPGSRSAPLAYGLAEAEAQGIIDLHVRLDERGAAFFALGLAKASGEPVAIACTSGTAVADYHPAVLEADLARVPLIVLTADRPAELHGVLASQTIDQAGIFGNAVRASLDLPADAMDDEVADAAHSVVSIAANLAKPGPVQLNAQYCEPLSPGNSVPMSMVSTSATYLSSCADSLGAQDDPELAMPETTVVIAGDGAGPIARQVAEANGWPLLAEPTSGALGSPNQIAAYRYLLSHLASTVTHAVVFGRPTLNRAVNEFLANPHLHVTVITQGDPPWPNAWRNTAQFLPAVPNNWLQPQGDTSAFLEKWGKASRAASIVLNRLASAGNIAATGGLAESPYGPLAVARAISEAQGPTTNLVVGASNPIRDIDLVSLPAAGKVFSNRGVAGIDGTIATALGIATCAQGITRLYVGDLTFLHDVGSLLLGYGEERPQLQIIVANDAGGSIFTGLEHGAWAEAQKDRAETLRRVFTTPQFANLEGLCAGFGVSYTCITELAGLEAALACPEPGVQVVEVKLNGQGRRLLQRELAQAIQDEITLG